MSQHELYFFFSWNQKYSNCYTSEPQKWTLKRISLFTIVSDKIFGYLDITHPLKTIKNSGFKETITGFFFHQVVKFGGLPQWLSGKESTCQCRRCGFNSWIGKIPWRRKWQPTPVFWPEKFHGQNLVGYSLWGYKELDMTSQLNNNNNNKFGIINHGTAWHSVCLTEGSGSASHHLYNVWLESNHEDTSDKFRTSISQSEPP